jgi:hypothetical protein
VLCEADHLFKHDPTTGWTVTQPHPGTFIWTAPTGRRHVITPERYDPLPDPLPPPTAAPSPCPRRSTPPPRAHRTRSPPGATATATSPTPPGPPPPTSPNDTAASKENHPAPTTTTPTSDEPRLLTRQTGRASLMRRAPGHLPLRARIAR